MHKKDSNVGGFRNLGNMVVSSISMLKACYIPEEPSCGPYVDQVCVYGTDIYR